MIRLENYNKANISGPERENERTENSEYTVRVRTAKAALDKAMAIQDPEARKAALMALKEQYTEWTVKEVVETDAAGKKHHSIRRSKVSSINWNIDPDRTRLNYHIVSPLSGYVEEIEGVHRRYVRRKVQDNAVYMMSWVVGTNKEMWERYNYDPKVIHAYFQDAYNWFVRHFGQDPRIRCEHGENIISAVVHLDETSPHMHLNMVPLLRDRPDKGDGKDGRINATAIADKFSLHKYQKSFWEEVDSKYGVREPNYASGAEHQNHSVFAAKLLDAEIEAKTAVLNTPAAKVPRVAMEPGQHRVRREAYDTLYEAYTKVCEENDKLRSGESVKVAAVSEDNKQFFAEIRDLKRQHSEDSALIASLQKQAPAAEISRKLRQRNGRLYRELEDEVRAEEEAEYQRKRAQSRQQGRQQGSGPKYKSW